MVIYEEKFLARPDYLLNRLMELSWLSIKSARYEYFMASHNISYKYGNEDYTYKSNSFTPYIEFEKQCIEKYLENINFGKVSFNGCFLNRYDNSRQALGRHSDDSPNMDSKPPIAVISLGEEREIWWKEKGFKGVVPKENRQKLANGSLFIMPPGFQENHAHKIPKHDRECGRRISLTFRNYLM